MHIQTTNIFKRIAPALMLLPLFTTVFCLGQCPERKKLWDRLNYVRQVPASSAPEHMANLKEFLSYETVLKGCGIWRDSIHALLLQRIGVTYHHLREFMKAADYISRSVSIITSFPEKDKKYQQEIIHSYYILSRIYDSLHATAKKEAAADSCLFTSIRLQQFTEGSLQILIQRVARLFARGEYQRSYDYSVIGEAASENNHNLYDRPKYLEYFFAIRINVLLHYKKFATAERLLLDRYQQSEKLNNFTELAMLLELLALSSIEKKAYDEAHIRFKQALHYHNKLRDPLGIFRTWLNIGYHVYHKGYKHHAKARAHFEKALDIFNSQVTEAGYYLERLNLFANIANTYASEGRFDSAFVYFQHAFDVLKPGFNEADLVKPYAVSFISKEHNVNYLVALILDKGEAYFKHYESTRRTDLARKAISTYKLAEQFLNTLKDEQFDFESKLFWRASSRRLFENAIKASFAIRDFESAFYFFQRSRSILLNEQINEQKWLSEKELAQQGNVKRTITEKRRTLFTLDPSSPAYTALQLQLAEDNRQLDLIKTSLKYKSPWIARVNGTTISLSRFRMDQLENSQSLLEIFAGDSAVYLLGVSKQRVQFSIIDKKEYDRLTGVFNSYLTQPSLLNREFHQFSKSSHALYTLIFKDISIPPGRLTIATDGIYFPFEALVSQISNNGVTYFLESHIISYSYSSNYLVEKERTHKPVSNAGDFLGIAPVTYRFNSELNPLPAGARSLSRLKRSFGSERIMTDSLATKANFLREYGNYRVIQLYTHASGTSYTGEPAIYFYDSILYLSDLIPEKQPATELIVISACESGKGENIPGEGIFNFNRGFASIGIPTVVTNSWVIEESASCRLTELFLKHISEELPADVALQKAKLEFMKSGSKKDQLPYYWASPMLTGRPSTHYTQQNTPVLIYLTCGILLLATLALLLRKKHIGKAYKR